MALVKMTPVLLVLLAVAPIATGFHAAAPPGAATSSSTAAVDHYRRVAQHQTPSSQSGRAIGAPGGSSTRLAAFADAAAAIDSFYVGSPYAAAALTCGAKASAADYVAQRRHIRTRAEEAAAEQEAVAVAERVLATAEQAGSELSSAPRGEGEEEGMATQLVNDMADTIALAIEEEPYNSARTVAFLLYGSIYQGMTQEFVYNHLYPVWFGTETTVQVVLTKVAFDLLIQTTLVTLPVAYLLKSVIFQYSPVEGLRRYKEDILEHGLLKKYFALWGPVQCLTFGVVPEHLRVSFIALVSFFWLIILSTISARPRQAELLEEEAATAVECSLVDGTTCNIDG